MAKKKTPPKKQTQQIKKSKSDAKEKKPKGNKPASSNDAGNKRSRKQAKQKPVKKAANSRSRQGSRKNKQAAKKQASKRLKAKEPVKKKIPAKKIKRAAKAKSPLKSNKKQLKKDDRRKGYSIAKKGQIRNAKGHFIGKAQSEIVRSVAQEMEISTFEVMDLIEKNEIWKCSDAKQQCFTYNILSEVVDDTKEAGGSMIVRITPFEGEQETFYITGNKINIQLHQLIEKENKLIEETFDWYEEEEGQTDSPMFAVDMKKCYHLLTGKFTVLEFNYNLLTMLNVDAERFFEIMREIKSSN